MTLFDEITEKLSKKCLYVVSLPDYPKGEISRPDTITKGGYTEDDLEYRISKFNFSGKMKGKEKIFKLIIAISDLMQIAWKSCCTWF